MRITILSLTLAAAASAQQVVAPTPEAVGPSRGQEIGNYNVVNSFETGYRWSLIDGNLGKYRSDVNYRNGVRLLGSRLSVNSKDGRGRYFDEILLNTIGLGNDPYQFSNLRVQKNGLYRYDMTWRLNEYFNPGLTVAGGQHLIDTRRRLQDHDLTLLPQSRFKMLFGYTRNTQTGPALSTVQQFAPRQDEFALFSNVRRERNEYRIGGDWNLGGVQFFWQRRWDYYKDDTEETLPAASRGNNPNDVFNLNSFRRTQPFHGSIPTWLGNVRMERSWMAVNARLSYAGGRRNFILDELAAGTGLRGAATERQILITGNARRPVVAGDLSLSFFPVEKLTVVNNTSVHSSRIDGDGVFAEFNNRDLSSTVVNFNYLGIRAVANATDAQYRITQTASVHAGYRFSNRRVRSIEASGDGRIEFGRDVAEQDNNTHSGLIGFRFRPVKPLTVNLDAEVTRANRPFFPISERNFHALSARAQYRVKNLTFGAGYRQNYNTNSVSLSAHSARARNYSGEFSWVANNWFAIDASYVKLHLDTATGLYFFAGTPFTSPVEDRRSLYFSNIHTGNLGARFGLGKRADLYTGYSITRDTGDGRGSIAARALPSDPVGVTLAGVQTFPLSFQSPLARLSVRLHGKMRWNAGWQFYRYREDFGLFSFLQNYRAHTGYTSLLWSF